MKETVEKVEKAFTPKKATLSLWVKEVSTPELSKMSNLSEHVDFERIADLVDGRVARDVETESLAHISDSSPCAEKLRRLTLWVSWKPIRPRMLHAT
jgi:hypothetical protein